MPRVRVVGLGPGDADLMSQRSARLLAEAPHARLRTRHHPAAAGFAHVASYDELYESADSFEDLYRAIVEDVARLAHEHGEVLYAVPGSPVVAERTVELLGERSDLEVILEPAVSVIDVACARLGRDPMAAQLRIVDALGSHDAFQGPGPLLVLQAYSAEVLAVVASRLEPQTRVILLHHLGLDDERIEECRASELVGRGADHLTSLWVEELRGPGVAASELVALVRLLRAECPWDAEQTHESLTRHLLEESYEALDALEALVRRGLEDEAAVAHVREELGDLLIQIIFHAELADEEGLFDFAGVADAVREKLTGRHPHVFGDVRVQSASDVEVNWEKIKRAEKGRQSVLDGVVWQLPALSLYAEVLAKAERLGVSEQPGAPSDALDTLCALVDSARRAGVDLEGRLRERALALAERVRRAEASGEGAAQRSE